MKNIPTKHQSNKQVKKIRNLVQKGFSQRAIAKELNLSRYTISKIVKEYNLITHDIPTVENNKNNLLNKPMLGEVKLDKTNKDNIKLFSEKYNVMVTTTNIVFVVNDEVITIPKVNEYYNVFLENINNLNCGVIDELLELYRKGTSPVTEEKKDNPDNILVYFKGNNIEYTHNNTLYVNGEVYDNTIIINRINYFKLHNLNKVYYFLKCIDKCFNNPSYQLVTTGRIFEFMKFIDIDITEDGDLIMYKVVNSNYTDCYTGTIDNSVGAVIPRLKRSQVDDNMDHLCSYGYHVCSLNYTNYFYSETRRVLRVILNPEDIVAIPPDYADSKIRCTFYISVKDITEDYLNYIENGNIDSHGYFSEESTHD